MENFKDYIESLDITHNLTETQLSNAVALLNLYAPLVCHSSQLLKEYSYECRERRRQSISDFINLAIDYDHDKVSRQITERLTSTENSMQLLEILEDALLMVRDDPRSGSLHYRILNGRYFDCRFSSIEAACLKIGISTATYYRHLEAAQKQFAAVLWGIVMPAVFGASRHPKPEDSSPGASSEEDLRDK